MRHLVAVASVALWAASSLAGIPQGARAAEEIDPKLVAAAKKEGEVVYYTSMSREVTLKITKNFTKKFGIPVKLVRKGTNQVIQMVEAERQAGIHRADAISFSDPAVLYKWRDEGRFADFQLPWEDKFDKRFRDPKGVLVPLFPLMIVFGFNKAVVPPDKGPRSWQDLTDPKWKGMLGHSDPAYSGSTGMTIMVLKDKFGWDYYKKLAANKPLMTQSIGATPKMMSTKEAPIAALALSFYLSAQVNQGQPFEIVYPKEGPILYVHYAGLSKGAPHPSAGKLFLAYYTSAENQQFLTKIPEAFYPARTDVKPAPGSPPLSQLNFMPIDFHKFEKEKASITDNFKKIMTSQ